MKKQILENLRSNSIEKVELPMLKNYVSNSLTLVQDFISSSIAISAQVVEISKNNTIKEILSTKYGQPLSILNFVDEVGLPVDQLEENIDLFETDLLIIKGEYGIAENGAIWVDTSHLPKRILPFICDKLAICLSKEKILENMMDFYEKTEGMEYDFGVLIAGPSKTADIEQSLVIGAQGARELIVFLL